AADDGRRPTEAMLAALHSAQHRTGDGPVLAFRTASHRVLSAAVPAPDGGLTLLAIWPLDLTKDADLAVQGAASLVEDAARSLQLALERETSERAHREAAALRRSQDLQRDFLSRLSHELRTPLTAIHGYADTLLQSDVIWDQDSQSRFLRRITTESARLGRLVGDLLDLSAIDSDTLRLHQDWCDVELIIDAARACLPMSTLDRVHVECSPLPAVWADHDRLEQVLVNLMDNAIRHNSDDTTVRVAASAATAEVVTITVADDGIGLPDGADDATEGISQRRSTTSGAGLGLSISRAIIAAHGGTLQVERPARGTRWVIGLPVAGLPDSTASAAADRG
ncbi:MAG TPA: ATP-binding protein, partial [Mycobacteriales bacterium]